MKFALITIDPRGKLMPYVTHYGSLDDLMEFIKTSPVLTHSEFVILPMEEPKKDFGVWPSWQPSLKGKWPSHPLVKLTAKDYVPPPDPA